MYVVNSARSFDIGNDVSVVTVLAQPEETYERDFGLYMQVYAFLIYLEILGMFKEDLENSEGARYALNVALRVLKAISWPVTLLFAGRHFAFVVIHEIRSLDSSDPYRSWRDFIPFPACFNFNFSFGIAASLSFVQVLVVLNLLVFFATKVAKWRKGNKSNWRKRIIHKLKKCLRQQQQQDQQLQNRPETEENRQGSV
jgi:hypothetical protein